MSSDRSQIPKPGGARQLSPEHLALGHALRDLRSERGLSQEALAARCGLHRTYVGGIERGERNVSFGNLLRVARALGVPGSELLARAERLMTRPGAGGGTAAS